MPYDYSGLQGYYGTEDPTKMFKEGSTSNTPEGAVKPQPASGYSPAYGGIPAVPMPSATLGQTITANLGQMPDIKNLGKKVSNYFWNQTTGRVPGYAGMAGQSAENIGSMLRGEVPDDVKYQLMQGAAERGVSRGVPGSELTEADYLRGLGLTSLGLMQYGEGALTGALGRAESIPMFDISKYMLTPQDVYNSQLMANVYGAAPVPSAAAAAAKNTLNQASRTTPGSVISGGGGGMPSFSPNPLASAQDRWASQWAPVGDIWQPGSEAGYTQSFVDWNDPYLQDLMSGGAGGYEDLGDIGQYYDYSPGAGADYSGYA